MNGSNSSGKSDILNLAAVGFLTLSLVAVISVTTNSDVRQIFAPKAVNVDYPTNPTIDKNDIGYDRDIVINTVAELNRAGYDCSKGGCAPGVEISGYYKAPNGKYYAINGTGNDPRTYFQTSKAVVDAKNQTEEIARKQEEDAIKREEEATAKANIEKAKENAAIKRAEAAMARQDKKERYTETSTSVEDLGVAGAGMSRFITHTTTTTRDGTGKIVYTKTTSTIPIVTTTVEKDPSGGYIQTTTTGLRNTDTGEIYSTKSTQTKIEAQPTQSIAVNQAGNLIVKIENGGTASFPSECTSGYMDGGICTPKLPEATTYYKPSLPNTINSEAPVDGGCKNGYMDGGICAPYAEPETVTQVTPEYTYGFLNAVTFGSFENYVKTYQEVAAETPQVAPDANVFEKTVNYAQQAFSKKGVAASTQVGTTLTAEVAAIMAAPAIIGAGATVAAAGGSGLAVVGAVGGQTMLTVGAISTMAQTTDALSAQYSDFGSKEANEKTAAAALSWLNLKSADLLSKGPVVKIFGKEVLTKAINTGVSGINLVYDSANAYNTCTNKDASSLDCGGAITAAVVDVGMGGLDYKQGQLSFGNPFAKAAKNIDEAQSIARGVKELENADISIKVTPEKQVAENLAPEIINPVVVKESENIPSLTTTNNVTNVAQVDPETRFATPEEIEILAKAETKTKADPVTITSTSKTNDLTTTTTAAPTLLTDNIDVSDQVTNVKVTDSDIESSTPIALDITDQITPRTVNTLNIEVDPADALNVPTNRTKDERNLIANITDTPAAENIPTPPRKTVGETINDAVNSIVKPQGAALETKKTTGIGWVGFTNEDGKIQLPFGRKTTFTNPKSGDVYSNVKPLTDTGSTALSKISSATTKDGQDVIIKEFDISHPELPTSRQLEKANENQVNLLEKHDREYPNSKVLPKLIDKITDKNGNITGYVMEKIPGISFGDLYNAQGKKLTDEQINQIKDALDTYYHETGSIHGDLFLSSNPEFHSGNIIFTGDSNRPVVFIDPSPGMPYYATTNLDAERNKAYGILDWLKENNQRTGAPIDQLPILAKNGANIPTTKTPTLPQETTANSNPLAKARENVTNWWNNNIKDDRGWLPKLRTENNIPKTGQSVTNVKLASDNLEYKPIAGINAQPDWQIPTNKPPEPGKLGTGSTTYKVGSGENNQFVIKDESVNSESIKITKSGGKVTLENVGDNNITLNGNAVSKNDVITISKGDIIKVEEVGIKFEGLNSNNSPILSRTFEPPRYAFDETPRVKLDSQLGIDNNKLPGLKDDPGLVAGKVNDKTVLQSNNHTSLYYYNDEKQAWVLADNIVLKDGLKISYGNSIINPIESVRANSPISTVIQDNKGNFYIFNIDKNLGDEVIPLQESKSQTSMFARARALLNNLSSSGVNGSTDNAKMLLNAGYSPKDINVDLSLTINGDLINFRAGNIVDKTKVVVGTVVNLDGIQTTTKNVVDGINKNIFEPIGNSTKWKGFRDSDGNIQFPIGKPEEPKIIPIGRDSQPTMFSDFDENFVSNKQGQITIDTDGTMTYKPIDTTTGTYYREGNTGDLMVIPEEGIKITSDTELFFGGSNNGIKIVKDDYKNIYLVDDFGNGYFEQISKGGKTAIKVAPNKMSKGEFALNAAADVGYAAIGAFSGYTIYVNKDIIRNFITNIINPGYYSPTLDTYVYEKDGKWYRTDTGEEVNEATYLKVTRINDPNNIQYSFVDKSTFESTKWKEFSNRIQQQTGGSLTDVKAITEAIYKNMTYDYRIGYEKFIRNNVTGSNYLDYLKNSKLISMWYSSFRFSLSNRYLQDAMAENATVCFEFAVAEQAYLATLGIKSELATAQKTLPNGESAGHAFLVYNDQDGNKWILDPTNNTALGYDDYIRTYNYKNVIITPSIYEYLKAVKKDSITPAIEENNTTSPTVEPLIEIPIQATENNTTSPVTQPEQQTSQTIPEQTAQQPTVNQEKPIAPKIVTQDPNTKIVNNAIETMGGCQPGYAGYYNACNGEYYKGKILQSGDTVNTNFGNKPPSDPVDLYWCTSLVKDAAKAAGVQIDKNYGAGEMYQNFYNKKAVTLTENSNIRSQTTSIKPGMVAFVTKESQPGYIGHVGIVSNVQIVNSDTVFVTIVQANAGTVQATYQLDKNGNLVNNINGHNYYIRGFGDILKYGQGI